jgi:nucleoside-diphosphate-sugar epimerase
MALLATGAAGLIALNIVEHLLSAGRDLVGPDRIPLPPRVARARRQWDAVRLCPAAKGPCDHPATIWTDQGASSSSNVIGQVSGTGNGG